MAQLLDGFVAGSRLLQNLFVGQLALMLSEQLIVQPVVEQNGSFAEVGEG